MATKIQRIEISTKKLAMEERVFKAHYCEKTRQKKSSNQGRKVTTRKKDKKIADRTYKNYQETRKAAGRKWV